MGKRAQDWTPKETLRAVAETASLEGEALGEYLRRHGLHGEQLTQWREIAISALQGPVSRRQAKAEGKRVKELEQELRRKEKALAETAALLVLRKNSQCSLGGRGRRHGREERAVTTALVREAVAAGARLESACNELGLDARTIQRWQGIPDGEDRRRGPTEPPANALTKAEEDDIITLLTSEEFADLSPHQVVPKLADMKIYKASERTMYRLPKCRKLQAHRGKSRARTVRRPTEHRATGPRSVWSWDITYLRSPIKGVFWLLYMVVDVWSRKVVAPRCTTANPTSSPPSSSVRPVSARASTAAASWSTATTAPR